VHDNDTRGRERRGGAVVVMVERQRRRGGDKQSKAKQSRAREPGAKTIATNIGQTMRQDEDGRLSMEHHITSHRRPFKWAVGHGRGGGGE